MNTTSLIPSPFNRAAGSGLDDKSIGELAASIATHGVLQPLIVRPLPAARAAEAGEGVTHEIIAGERRWLAAQQAGLTEVPVTIRDVSDTEAAELQAIENLQRANLHYLEESLSYQRLLDLPADDGKAPRYTVETLAARLCKSTAWLSGSLKLARLPEAIHTACWSGKCNASIALLLARIPDPAAATRAALEILCPGRPLEALKDPKLPDMLADPEIEPMSFRAAKDHIQANYMIRLKGAPFDTKAESGNQKAEVQPLTRPSATLSPSDGERDGERGGPQPSTLNSQLSCPTCPHRTGNQMDLYPDLDKGASDICTWPACYHAKAKAAAEKERKRLAEDGIKLLPPRQAAKVLDDTGHVRPESGMVDLSAPFPGDRKHRAWEEVIAQHIPSAGLSAVKDGEGHLHIVMPVEDAQAAAEAAGKHIQLQTPPEVVASLAERRKEMLAEAEKIKLAILADSREQGRATAWLAWYAGHVLPPEVLHKWNGDKDHAKFLATRTVNHLAGLLVEAALEELPPLVEGTAQWQPAFSSAATIAKAAI